MKRRPLLATLATSVLGAAAGCGYAYGGGDLRDEGHVGTAGFGTTEYVLGDDRIVAVENGMIFDHDVGSLIDGSSVAVTSRTGEGLWRHTQEAKPVGFTASDPVYLLDEQGDIFALAGSSPEDERSGGVGHGGTELWRTALDRPRPTLAGDARGPYVAVDGGLIAVRDGTVAWEVDLPSAVESVFAVDETILVTTGEEALALTSSGSERWRVETDDLATLAIAGETVGIRDGRRITVRELTSGDQLWMAETDGPGGPPAMTGDRLYVTDRGGVRAFDAANGDLEWHSDVSVGVKPPLVAAPEGVYGVSGRCRTVAVDENGTRWTREVSVRECSIVGGWLDGGTVAFLFESGDLRWLQRMDQNPGLL